MRAGTGRASFIIGCINKIFNICNESSEKTLVLTAYQWRNNWKNDMDVLLGKDDWNKNENGTQIF